MNFTQSFRTALDEGQDFETLLKMVRQFELQTEDAEHVYEQLEELWLDLGFDSETNGGERQAKLERVMEKIWYELPRTQAPSD